MVVEGLHLVGIEGDHVVYRLHDDGTVLQTDGLAIDKRFVRHVVIAVIRMDVAHPLVLEDQTRDTIARSRPDVVLLILHDGVDHVV